MNFSFLLHNLYFGNKTEVTTTLTNVISVICIWWTPKEKREKVWLIIFELDIKHLKTFLNLNTKFDFNKEITAAGCQNPADDPT